MVYGVSDYQHRLELKAHNMWSIFKLWKCLRQVVLTEHTALYTSPDAKSVFK